MRWWWLPPVLMIGVSAAGSVSADPTPKLVGVIDRVVAVVDHDPILLSELRSRAKPFAKQIEAAFPKDAAKRIVAEEQMTRELLGKMIDERLVAAEARLSELSVSAAEVDAALRNIASTQSITVPQLLEAARDAGLHEPEYREELRRQVLEGKVLQLRVVPRIKGLAGFSEAGRAERVEAERRAWLDGLRQGRYIEVRL
ncbi:MAG: SurA N-terminal domain-containing protein [Deltaproteobacteria bacterium]|nr:SurA N-terminal domain-containing protein [Deltaproteobacteria bacterium]